MKKILSQVLIFSLLFNMCLPAFADRTRPTSKQGNLVKEHQRTVEKAEQDFATDLESYNKLLQELEYALDDALETDNFSEVKKIEKQLKKIHDPMAGDNISLAAAQLYHKSLQEGLGEPSLHAEEPKVRPLKMITGAQFAEKLDQGKVHFEDLIGYIYPVYPAGFEAPSPEVVAAAATLMGNTVQGFPLITKGDKNSLQALVTNEDNLIWKVTHPYQVNFRYIQRSLLRKIDELKCKENRTALEALALSELRLTLYRIIKLHLDNGIPNTVAFNPKTSDQQTDFGPSLPGDDKPEKQIASQKELLVRMQEDSINEFKTYLEKARSSKDSMEFQRTTFSAPVATKLILLNKPEELTKLVDEVNAARGDLKILWGLINTHMDELGGEKLDYHYATVVAAIFSAIPEVVRQADYPADSIKIIKDQLFHFIEDTDEEGDKKYILPVRASALETLDTFYILQTRQVIPGSTAKPVSQSIADKIPAFTQDEKDILYDEALQTYAPLVRGYSYAHTVYGLDSHQAEAFADRLVMIMDRMKPELTNHSNNHSKIYSPDNPPTPDGYVKRGLYKEDPIYIHDVGGNENPTLERNTDLYYITSFLAECLAWVYIPELVFRKIGLAYRLARGAVLSVPASLYEAGKAFNMARKARVAVETGAKGKTAARQVVNMVGRGGMAAERGSMAAKLGRSIEGASAAVESSNLPAVIESVQPVASVAQSEVQAPLKAFLKTFFEKEKYGALASNAVKGNMHLNLTTLYTIEEKGGEWTFKTIRNNKTLKQLIREGQLNTGTPLFAQQLNLDGTVTRWRLKIPQGTSYNELAESLVKGNWEVFSGDAQAVMQKYSTGQRNAIFEKFKEQIRIANELDKKGGLDIYVNTGKEILPLADFQSQALLFGHLNPETTNLYLLPKGTKIKSAVKGVKGQAAKDFVTAAELQNSGAVVTTVAEWKTMLEKMLPEIIMETPKGAAQGVKELATVLFYHSANRAAASLATTPSLLSGTGMAAKTVDAARIAFPQVKVAKAFSHMAAPKWVPEHLKGLFSNAQRLGTSQFAGTMLFFGLLNLADHWDFVNIMYGALTSAYLNQDMDKALADLPALKKHIDEQKKAESQKKGSNPTEKAPSIVDDVLAQKKPSHSGEAWNLPLMLIWGTYTQVKDFAGIKLMKWTDLRLLTDAQKESFLLNDYYYGIKEPFNKALNVLSREVSVDKNAAVLGGRKEAFKKKEKILEMAKHDSKLFKNIDTVYGFAEENLRATENKENALVMEWLNMDLDLIILKARLYSKLDTTDTWARQRISTLTSKYLGNVQAIRKDTKKTIQQKKKAVQKFADEISMEMKWSQDLSISKQTLYTDLLPQYAEKINKMFNSAREVLMTPTASFEQKKASRNEALAEAFACLLEKRKNAFLQTENVIFYTAQDPQFGEQIKKLWDDRIAATRAVYTNSSLSEKDKKDELAKIDNTFETSGADLMNEKEIQVFLSDNRKMDAFQHALALVYPEYEEKIRAAFVAKNQQATPILQNKKLAKDKKKEALNRVNETLEQNLIAIKSEYLRKPFQEEISTFWGKFAHEASKDLWDAVAAEMMLWDVQQLLEDMGKVSQAIPVELILEIYEFYGQTFVPWQQALYEAQDVDAAMQELSYQKEVYKGKIYLDYLEANSKQ